MVSAGKVMVISETTIATVMVIIVFFYPSL